MLQPVPLPEAVAVLQQRWQERQQRWQERQQQHLLGSADGRFGATVASGVVVSEDAAAAQAAAVAAGSNGGEDGGRLQELGRERGLLLAGEASFPGTAAHYQLQQLLGEAAEDEVWEWVRAQENKALEGMWIRDEDGSGPKSHPLWGNGSGDGLEDVGSGEVGVGGSGAGSVGNGGTASEARVVAGGNGMGVGVGRGGRCGAAGVMPVPTAAAGVPPLPAAAGAVCCSSRATKGLVGGGAVGAENGLVASAAESGLGLSVGGGTGDVTWGWGVESGSSGVSTAVWNCSSSSSRCGRGEQGAGGKQRGPSAPTAGARCGEVCADKFLFVLFDTGVGSCSCPLVARVRGVVSAGRGVLPAAAAAGGGMLKPLHDMGAGGRWRHPISNRSSRGCCHVIIPQRPKASVVVGCKRLNIS